MNNNFLEQEGFLFTSIFPIDFWNKAKALGLQRTNINKKNMKDVYYDPYYFRGELSENIETLGILGELIVRDFLTKNNVPFVFNPLVDIKPIKNFDIKCYDKNIDVKTVRIDDVEFRVNEKAYNKNKKINLYWFVKLINNVSANHFLYKHNTISLWEIKKCYFTNAYCQSINICCNENKNNIFNQKLEWFM